MLMNMALFLNSGVLKLRLLFIHCQVTPIQDHINTFSNLQQEVDYQSPSRPHCSFVRYPSQCGLPLLSRDHPYKTFCHYCKRKGHEIDGFFKKRWRDEQMEEGNNEHGSSGGTHLQPQWKAQHVGLFSI
jgi:hypothetical protein